MDTASPKALAAEHALLGFIRIGIGWMFLWAAISHFGDDKYVFGFLSHTKTFAPIYGPLAHSAALPAIGFLVEYGHLLIGLSLISGLLVRASAPFGILIMVTYWTAHMDFPYIENVHNVLIDYHLIYSACLGILILRGAGHFFGLDGVVAQWPAVRTNAALRWLVG